MPEPRLRVPLALVAVALTGVLSACSALPIQIGNLPAAPGQAQPLNETDPSSTPAAPAEGADKPARTGSVTLPAMFTRGNSGGVSEFVVSMQPGTDGMLVEVAESQVAGVGQQWRAAAWTAATLGTLMLGTDINTSFRFESRGLVDGPSAGGVTTVGVLSLLRGDPVKTDVVMTGTITATGTIGPVGGIPEKVQGVIDSRGKYTKVLIPLGSRNSTTMDGRSVDVVALGRSGGVEVVEVGDINAAYQHFTGKPLTSDAATTTPKLDDKAYSKLEIATRKQLTEYLNHERRFKALSAGTQADGQYLHHLALQAAQEAQRLLDQGLPGGALMEATEANLLMRITANGFGTLQDVRLEDTRVLADRLEGAGTVERTITEYLDGLNHYKPKSLGDAEVLAATYGATFDSLTLYLFATQGFKQLLADARAERFGSLEELLAHALLPILYLEIADAGVATADAIFEVGRDLDGPPIPATANPKQVGELLRRASEANHHAFSSIVVSGIAEKYGMSISMATERLGANDSGVALAHASPDAFHVINAYLGKDNPNAGYAAMGHGWSNFARNSGLLDKYYNMGVVDAELELAGVRSDAVLSHTLDHGRARLVRSLGNLSENQYTSVLLHGEYEAANLKRGGDLETKFEAISSFNGAYAMSRAIAYLGGFARER